MKGKQPRTMFRIGFQFHSSIAWDTFCLKCFGFSNEVMHYIVALENQAEVYSTLDAAECFCPGTPRSFQAALQRMNSKKGFMQRVEAAALEAADKQPLHLVTRAAASSPRAPADG